MDNYNNMQGQQPQYGQAGYANYQPQYGQAGYVNQQPQYDQGVYINKQYDSNTYLEPQYNSYGNVNQGNNGFYSYNKPKQKNKLITISTILGLIGAVIILVGLMLPAIDFSHFHSEVDIQYNLFKVGKNVGLISGMWNVIPYVILVSVIILMVLSFIRIPVLKVLPTVLIICMFVLMLADMGNVVTWASDLLDKLGIVLEKDITVGEIFKSLMPGIYIMVAGVMVSLVSCFVKIRD